MKRLCALALCLLLSACAGQNGYGSEKTTCSAAAVSGMKCEICASIVAENLKKQHGVTDVKTDLASGKVEITTLASHDIKTSTIKRIVRKSGYTFTGMTNSCDL